MTGQPAPVGCVKPHECAYWRVCSFHAPSCPVGYGNPMPGSHPLPPDPGGPRLPERDR